MKKSYLAIVLVFVSFAWCENGHAEGSSIAVLRQGLLGAGTGAAATAFSGAKGDAVWKGALIGMGVNVVGGALLDVISEPSSGRAVAYVSQPQPVYVSQPQTVYVSQPQPVMQRGAVIRPVSRQRANSVYRRVYRTGYRNGYDRGYRDGYDDAAYDMTQF